MYWGNYAILYDENTYPKYNYIQFGSIVFSCWCFCFQVRTLGNLQIASVIRNDKCLKQSLFLQRKTIFSQLTTQHSSCFIKTHQCILQQLIQLSMPMKLDVLFLRKHFPCSHTVIETRVEVWEKLKWEHELARKASSVSTLFPPNFYNVFL